MKNITIIGGGVLGSQIAFQVAYTGFNVTMWLRSEGSIQRCKDKLLKVKESYIEAINLMDTDDGKLMNNWCRGIADYDNFNKEECLNKVNSIIDSIKFETDLRESVKDADLIIESMTEDFDAKKELAKKSY